MKKNYYYLISYNFKTKDNQLGFGQLEATVDRPLNSFQTIEDARQYIKKSNDADNIIILNIIPVKYGGNNKL